MNGLRCCTHTQWNILLSHKKKKKKIGTSHHGVSETNPTRKLEVAGSQPQSVDQGSGIAVSYGVVAPISVAVVWCRPVGIAPI